MKIATLLRGGNLPKGYFYPLEMRATRDRRRRKRDFFFDARADLRGIREIVSNAHVPLQRLRIEDVLWLEIESAQTMVDANGRFDEGLHFSRIPVD